MKPIHEFRTLLKVLEESDELVRVTREVDPRFELAAVLRAVQRRLNKAIIFEHVKGFDMPVASNVLGSHARAAIALGLERKELSRTFGRALNELALFPEGSRAGGEDLDGDYERVTLGQLPIVTHCELDAGPYITAGVVLSRERDSGIYNLSYHRMQQIGPDELRLRITPGHHLGVFHDQAEKLGQPLPIAILLGAPSSVQFAAAVELPPRVDELRLAAALEGGPLLMSRCQTSDLRFPAGTEIVIEGELQPDLREPEGPFGESTGYYVPIGRNHVVKVRGVYHRPKPCYHTLFAGSWEQIVIRGLSIAGAVHHAVARVAPSVSDVAIWPFAHNCVVQMSEQFDGHAKQALLAALGAAAEWVRLCTIVDEDVDIYDPSDVIWAVATRSKPDRDVLIVPGVPFRHSAEDVLTGRVGTDATMPFPPGKLFEWKRRRAPGEDQVRLADYLDAGAAGRCLLA